jgi:hypothetical protein
MPDEGYLPGVALREGETDNVASVVDLQRVAERTAGCAKIGRLIVMPQCCVDGLVAGRDC